MQSFPFDSQLTFDENNLPVYDRAVSSQPLRTLIGELFTTGVMPNPSTNFQVTSGTDGMTVQVLAGFAVIDGGLCQETETRTLEVTAADSTYDRIDTVVLRWNENVDVRTADLYVVAGTPSATPVRPTLQRDNSIYEIGLADIFITKRVATITDDKITDTRYESERCGIVSSVSEWDTTTIYQQIQAELAGFKANEEAEFTTWFDYMKDQLSEDAAGHLQQEIDDLNELNYTSGDTELEPTTSVSVPLLTSGETSISRWAKVSNMFKNIRYCLKQITQINNDLTNQTLSVTPSVNNVSIELKRYGNVVQFYLTNSSIINLSASQWHTLGTIADSNFIPNEDIKEIIPINGSGDGFGYVQINTDGTIKVYSKTLIISYVFYNTTFIK